MIARVKRRWVRRRFFVVGRIIENSLSLSFEQEEDGEQFES
jgi:hypothetical protein